jgi:CheY-like chemotaxis protein
MPQFAQEEFILLIDDDTVANFLHKSMIKGLDLGYEVYTCVNGQQGLDFLEACFSEQKVPRLILVDINMPVMDGFGFLEIYKDRNYHQLYETVVAVLTTSTNPRDLARIEALGIECCLTKPLTKNHIPALLENCSEPTKGISGSVE